MMQNPFLRNLQIFAERNEISFAEMRDMVLTWNEPFTIYASKLNGRNIVREMYSVNGPSGNVKYDYDALGYMIFYDQSVNDYRTIVLENVTKIKKNGKNYIVK
jgi:hypothetical protein